MKVIPFDISTVHVQFGNRVVIVKTWYDRELPALSLFVPLRAGTPNQKPLDYTGPASWPGHLVARW